MTIADHHTFQYDADGKCLVCAATIDIYELPNGERVRIDASASKHAPLITYGLANSSFVTARFVGVSR